MGGKRPLSSGNAQGFSAAPLNAETLHPALERRRLEAEDFRRALFSVDPAFGYGEDALDVTRPLSLRGNYGRTLGGNNRLGNFATTV